MKLAIQKLVNPENELRLLNRTIGCCGRIMNRLIINEVPVCFDNDYETFKKNTMTSY